MLKMLSYWLPAGRPVDGILVIVMLACRGSADVTTRCCCGLCYSFLLGAALPTLSSLFDDDLRAVLNMLHPMFFRDPVYGHLVFCCAACF